MRSKTPWYVRDTELGEAFERFHSACNDKTVLEDKTRELLMAALACVFRCPHCTETHIKRALEVGCSRQEVKEALLIAAVEAAGTQLAWKGDIYEKYLG